MNPAPQGTVRRVLQTLNLALASGFFLSYIPVSFRRGKRWTGAGMVGSLWGLVSLSLVPQARVPQILTLASAMGLAIMVCGWAEEYLGHRDDQRIVFDEWVGYWIAVAFLPRKGPVLAGAFLLFRLFDMWKGPAGRALSKCPGGFGVVLDDILAAFYTNLSMRAILFFLSF